MYKILGGDGKEYGPVTTETLRQWMAEGRANAQTQVQPEGTTGWVALGSLPEFAAAAAPVIPGVTAPAAVPTGNAAQLVSGPAIGLIVTAILGALAQIASLLINVLGVGMAGAGMQDHGRGRVARRAQDEEAGELQLRHDRHHHRDGSLHLAVLLDRFAHRHLGHRHAHETGSEEFLPLNPISRRPDHV
jgi:hypothetical protein